MISRITKNNKEILIVDFSDCDENQMISLVEEGAQILLASNKPLLLLSIYNDQVYATPKFMNVVREETAKFIHMLEKQAIVGLSDTKKIILNGYNLSFKRNVRSFNSKEAISFLIDDFTTDRDVPDHLR